MLLRLIVPDSAFIMGIKSPLWKIQNLAVMYLAGLTPPDIDVELIDETITEIPFDTKADIVGISYTCAVAKRAYEIADHYRRIGVTVVLGGWEATQWPEKALEHADAIVVGEAEHVWHDVVTDFKKGALKPVYKSNALSGLIGLPLPRFDLYDQSEFFNVFPLFATRGCPYRCSYCSYWKYGGGTYRKRPVSEVIAQIKIIKERYASDDAVPPVSISFADDNIWGDKQYSKELFRKLIPLNIPWFGQGSVTQDEELFDLASESGCQLLFIGFESLYPANLKYLNKLHNNVSFFAKQIELMHRARISVGGSFMLGLPYDEKNVFTELESFFKDTCIEAPAIQVFRPMIGTEQFKENWKGKAECTDWDSILSAIPVFTPPGMTKREFRQQFVGLVRRICADDAIDQRLQHSSFPPAYFLNKGLQNFYHTDAMDTWIMQAQEEAC